MVLEKSLKDIFQYLPKKTQFSGFPNYPEYLLTVHLYKYLIYDKVYLSKESIVLLEEKYEEFEKGIFNTVDYVVDNTAKYGKRPRVLKWKYTREKKRIDITIHRSQRPVLSAHSSVAIEVKRLNPTKDLFCKDVNRIISLLQSNTEGFENKMDGGFLVFICNRRTISKENLSHNIEIVRNLYGNYLSSIKNIDLFNYNLNIFDIADNTISEGDCNEIFDDKWYNKYHLIGVILNLTKTK